MRVLFAISAALVATSGVISRWSDARLGPVFQFELLSEPLATVLYFVAYGFIYSAFVGLMATFILLIIRYVNFCPIDDEYRVVLSLASFLFSILISFYVFGLYIFSKIDYRFVADYKNVGTNSVGFVSVGYLANAISEISPMKFPAASALVFGCLALAGFVFYLAEQVLELLVPGVHALTGGA